MGDLQWGIAEVAWGNLFITAERSKMIDYSDWYLVEPSCFLAQSPEAYSGIYTLLLPLEVPVWLCSLLALATVLSIYKFYASSDAYPAVNVGNLILFGLSVAMRESDKFTHKKQSVGLR